MSILARLLAVIGTAAFLTACTAAGGLFDNNCSGNGMIDPGAAYCADYTSGR